MINFDFGRGRSAARKAASAWLWVAHAPVLGAALMLVQWPAAADNDVGASAGAPATEQGEYLARAGNCVSCHTQQGGKPFAGGVAFATPFGTLYSTNITPDTQTGIGGWTQQQFANALREGVRPDGQHLYPAFPYTAFTRISDADAAALFAYLKTLAPVRAEAPANELRFPFDQRWLLGAWKAMYFEAGRYVPDKTKSQQWNRGAYLVEGLGHCGACHTPRNFLGAQDAEQALSGGSYKDKTGGNLVDQSPSNLTSARNGLGSWSQEDIANYLKLGVNTRVRVFGAMNEVILNSTRHLSGQDVLAMAAYLKELPPNEQDSGAPADAQLMQVGELQYDIHCGTCHLPTGLGSSDTGPPLVGSAVALAADPASLINVTLYGAERPHEPPSAQWQANKWEPMGAFAEKLSDEQVAALASYIRNAWGNKAGKVTEAQVAKQR